MEETDDIDKLLQQIAEADSGGDAGSAFDYSRIGSQLMAPQQRSSLTSSAGRLGATDIGTAELEARRLLQQGASMEEAMLPILAAQERAKQRVTQTFNVPPGSEWMLKGSERGAFARATARADEAVESARLRLLRQQFRAENASSPTGRGTGASRATRAPKATEVDPEALDLAEQIAPSGAIYTGLLQQQDLYSGRLAGLGLDPQTAADVGQQIALRWEAKKRQLKFDTLGLQAKERAIQEFGENEIEKLFPADQAKLARQAKAAFYQSNPIEREETVMALWTGFKNAMDGIWTTITTPSDDPPDVAAQRILAQQARPVVVNRYIANLVRQAKKDLEPLGGDDAGFSDALSAWSRAAINNPKGLLALAFDGLGQSAPAIIAGVVASAATPAAGLAASAAARAAAFAGGSVLTNYAAMLPQETLSRIRDEMTARRLDPTNLNDIRTFIESDAYQTVTSKARQAAFIESMADSATELISLGAAKAVRPQLLGRAKRINENYAAGKMDAATARAELQKVSDELRRIEELPKWRRAAGLAGQSAAGAITEGLGPLASQVLVDGKVDWIDVFNEAAAGGLMTAGAGVGGAIVGALRANTQEIEREIAAVRAQIVDKPKQPGESVQTRPVSGEFVSGARAMPNQEMRQGQTLDPVMLGLPVEEQSQQEPSEFDRDQQTPAVSAPEVLPDIVPDAPRGPLALAAPMVRRLDETATEQTPSQPERAEPEAQQEKQIATPLTALEGQYVVQRDDGGNIVARGLLRRGDDGILRIGDEIVERGESGLPAEQLGIVLDDEAQWLGRIIGITRERLARQRRQQVTEAEARSQIDPLLLEAKTLDTPETLRAAFREAARAIRRNRAEPASALERRKKAFDRLMRADMPEQDRAARAREMIEDALDVATRPAPAPVAQAAQSDPQAEVAQVQQRDRTDAERLADAERQIEEVFDYLKSIGASRASIRRMIDALEEAYRDGSTLSELATIAERQAESLLNIATDPTQKQRRTPRRKTNAERADEQRAVPDQDAGGDRRSADGDGGAVRDGADAGNVGDAVQQDVRPDEVAQPAQAEQSPAATGIVDELIARGVDRLDAEYLSDVNQTAARVALRAINEDVAPEFVVETLRDNPRTGWKSIVAAWKEQQPEPVAQEAETAEAAAPDAEAIPEEYRDAVIALGGRAVADVSEAIRLGVNPAFAVSTTLAAYRDQRGQLFAPGPTPAAIAAAEDRARQQLKDAGLKPRSIASVISYGAQEVERLAELLRLQASPALITLAAKEAASNPVQTRSAVAWISDFLQKAVNVAIDEQRAAKEGLYANEQEVPASATYEERAVAYVLENTFRRDAVEVLKAKNFTLRDVIEAAREAEIRDLGFALGKDAKEAQLRALVKEKSGRGGKRSTAEPRSAAQALAVEQAERAVREWLGVAPEAALPNVRFVATAEDLPDGVRSDAAGVQGVYDPETGFVYIVASALATPEQAVGVYAHEVAHRSLAKYLRGDLGYADLQEQVEAWADAPQGSEERAIWEAAKKRADASGDYAGEILPYAIEEAFSRNVAPDARGGVVARALAAFVDLVRKAWQFVTGRAAPELSAQTLRDIASGVARYELSHPSEPGRGSAQYSMATVSPDVMATIERMMPPGMTPPLTRAQDRSLAAALIETRGNLRSIIQTLGQRLDLVGDRLHTALRDNQWPFYRFLQSVASPAQAERVFGALKTARKRAKLSAERLYQENVKPIDALAADIARATGRSIENVLNDIGVYAQARRAKEANGIIYNYQTAPILALRLELAQASLKVEQLATAFAKANDELTKVLSGVLKGDQLRKIQDRAVRLGKIKSEATRIKRALDAAQKGNAKASTVKALHERLLRVQARMQQVMTEVEADRDLIKLHGRSLRGLRGAMAQVINLRGKLASAQSELSAIERKYERAQENFQPRYAAGITDDMADQMMAGIIEAYGDQAGDVIRGADLYVAAYRKMLDELVAKRVILPEERARITRLHRNYVPLFLENDADPLAFVDDEETASGGGMMQRIIKRMSGGREADAGRVLVNPYAQLIQRVSATARRAESQPLKEELLRLANAGVSGVRVEQTPITGRSTIDLGGLTAIVMRDTEDGGKQPFRARIRLESQAAEDALQNANIRDEFEQIPFVQNGLRRILRWRAFFITRANLLFPIRNSWLGDVQERAANIASRDFDGVVVGPDGQEIETKISGKAIAAEVLRLTGNPAWVARVGSIGAAWARGEKTPNVDPEIAAFADELRDNGGLSVFQQYLNELRSDLYAQAKKLDAGWARATFDRIGRGLDTWAARFEIIVPLATYIAFRRAGLNQRDAAGETVKLLDFENRGASAVSSVLRSLFVFSGPALESAGQMTRALRGPRGPVVMTAIVIASYLLHGALAAMAPEDEFGVSRYDLRPVSELQSYSVVFVGDTPVKLFRGFGLPMLANAIGLSAHRYLNGVEDAGNAASHIVRALAKTTLPMQPPEFTPATNPAAFFFQWATPTELAFLAQIATNTNVFGAPIERKNIDPLRPKAEQGRYDTEEFYKEVAKTLFDATGIDISPEVAKTIIRNYAFGVLGDSLDAIVYDRDVKGLRTAERDEGLWHVLKPLGIKTLIGGVETGYRTAYYEAVQEAEAVIRKYNLAKDAPRQGDGRERAVRLAVAQNKEMSESEKRLVLAYITQATVNRREFARWQRQVSISKDFEARAAATAKFDEDNEARMIQFLQLAGRVPTQRPQ